jgi:hypothetical protein
LLSWSRQIRGVSKGRLQVLSENGREEIPTATCRYCQLSSRIFSCLYSYKRLVVSYIVSSLHTFTFTFSFSSTFTSTFIFTNIPFSQTTTSVDRAFSPPNSRTQTTSHAHLLLSPYWTNMSSFVSTADPLPAMELDIEYLSSLVSCLCTRRRVMTKDVKRRQMKGLEQHVSLCLAMQDQRPR